MLPTLKFRPFDQVTTTLAMFESLKNAFTSYTVIAYFDFDLDSVEETDASDFISADVFSQEYLVRLHTFVHFS